MLCLLGLVAVAAALARRTTGWTWPGGRFGFTDAASRGTSALAVASAHCTAGDGPSCGSCTVHRALAANARRSLPSGTSQALASTAYMMTPPASAAS